jgi:hypothetical protein
MRSSPGCWSGCMPGWCCWRPRRCRYRCLPRSRWPSRASPRGPVQLAAAAGPADRGTAVQPGPLRRGVNRGGVRGVSERHGRLGPRRSGRRRTRGPGTRPPLGGSGHASKAGPPWRPGPGHESLSEQRLAISGGNTRPRRTCRNGIPARSAAWPARLVSAGPLLIEACPHMASRPKALRQDRAGGVVKVRPLHRSFRERGGQLCDGVPGKPRCN